MLLQKKNEIMFLEIRFFSWGMNGPPLHAYALGEHYELRCNRLCSTLIISPGLFQTLF